jgi:hypothetical protein
MKIRHKEIGKVAYGHLILIITSYYYINMPIFNGISYGVHRHLYIYTREGYKIDNSRPDNYPEDAYTHYFFSEREFLELRTLGDIIIGVQLFYCLELFDGETKL